MAITAFNLSGGGKLKLTDTYQANHDQNGQYQTLRYVSLYIANKVKLLFVVYTSDSKHPNTSLSINCTSGKTIMSTTRLHPKYGNYCTYAFYSDVNAGSTINFGNLEASDYSSRFRAYAFN